MPLYSQSQKKKKNNDKTYVPIRAGPIVRVVCECQMAREAKEKQEKSSSKDL
jgi:hypothetical protein